MATKTKKMRMALASDHAGFKAKEALRKFLTKKGLDVKDMGTHSDASTDYPDYAFKVAKGVSSGRYNRGVLVCGSGLGMAIAANKVKGVRAAATWSIQTAKLASEHNWANVLCVSARITSLSTIKKMIQAWLKTPWDKGGRHERRIRKIRRFER